MSAQPLSIVVALDPGINPASIQEALPAGSHVRTAQISGDGAARRLLQDERSDLVIVGAAGHSDGALALIGEAARQRPDRPVIVLHTGSPNGFMEQAFQAGADDLITLPLSTAQLGFSVEKAIVRRRGAAPRAASGEVIAVLGPKGGTGKTLTACNLAVALGMQGARPVVVDLDLQFGDVGLALGLRPQRTIYDLAVSGGALDAEKVAGFLAEHESGAHALLAPLRPDQASIVDPAFLRSVFEALRARHDFVIVDTPPAFSAEVITTIDIASHLCMVGMLDVLSLKDTKIGLETLAQMGYEPDEVALVLNRADSNVGITPDDVERVLGRRPDVLVPSDRAIPRALTEGRTIVAAEPRSNAAKAFQTLTEMFTTPKPGGTDGGDATARRRPAMLLRGAH
jgi:pilus assembly protein CpaE